MTEGALPSLAVGMRFLTAGRTIGESDVIQFAGLSGDFTPIHVDETFAAATPHGTRIAHGPMIQAMALGLVAQAGAFGERVIGAVEFTWRPKAPVKIGDTIRAEATVTALRNSAQPGRGVATYQVIAINQRGEPVQSGEVVVVIRTM